MSPSVSTPATWGERQFAKVQFGKEVKTTHGTAVAATKILLGELFPAASDRKAVYPVDNIGVRMPSRRAVVYQYLSQGVLKVPNAYYQILPFFFSCGLKGDITAAETPPASGAYKWTHDPAMGATNTIDSFTMEFGNNVQAWRVAYGMFQRIKISGTVPQDRGDAAVSIEGEWFARKTAKNAFTGALAVPAVQEMNAKNCRLFADTTWAAKGGTELATILRKFELEILTGVHPYFGGSASKDFDIHREGVIDAKLTLDLEECDLTQAIWDTWDAGTQQAVRLQIPGPAIGGGAYDLSADLWGVWEDPTPMNSEDRGDHITTAVFHALYGDTGATGLALSCTTNAATFA